MQHSRITSVVTALALMSIGIVVTYIAIAMNQQEEHAAQAACIAIAAHGHLYGSYLDQSRCMQ